MSFCLFDVHIYSIFLLCAQQSGICLSVNNGHRKWTREYSEPYEISGEHLRENGPITTSNDLLELSWFISNGQFNDARGRFDLQIKKNKKGILLNFFLYPSVSSYNWVQRSLEVPGVIVHLSLGNKSPLFTIFLKSSPLNSTKKPVLFFSEKNVQ